MKNDKSPGSDGYTTEFLKIVFLDLGSLTVRSINHGFNKGKMSVTQTHGIITYIIIKKERIKKKKKKNAVFISI